jgi:6-phosphogluconolactonase
MKFRKSGQVLLASVVSLGVGLGITSCGQSNTIDFVYVTASKQNPGQISVYQADRLSGALTPIADSPYPSGGRNPIAEVTSPDGKFLYVVNHDDNALVAFGIGTDGKLYPTHTYQTPGTFPDAISISADGKLLFVVDNFQPNFTVTNTGPGDLVVYPINADGSLGSPASQTFSVAGVATTASFYPVCNTPIGVNVIASGGFVYVVNKSDCVNTQLGSISAFAVDSSGVLTPVAGSPFAAGTAPNAIASDPTSRFLYVTDGSQNQLIGYIIQSTGIISAMINGPFKTDVLPDAVVVDPRGAFVYVANFNANDVSAYAIDQTSGNPTQVAGSGSFGTGTGPTCVIVEPGLGRYVYTSNFLDNTVSGLELNPSTGTLIQVQNTPFLSSGQPTCAAAIPHGNHAVQHVQG